MKPHTAPRRTSRSFVSFSLSCATLLLPLSFGRSLCASYGLHYAKCMLRSVGYSATAIHVIYVSLIVSRVCADIPCAFALEWVNITTPSFPLAIEVPN